jgi:hypothetical protein
MPSGTYGEMKLVAVFMPSLFAAFQTAESGSGTPLTFSRAREIRNQAVGVLVTEELAAKLEQRRGFRDLDPDEFWSDWLQLRKESLATYRS